MKPAKKIFEGSGTSKSDSTKSIPEGKSTYGMPRCSFSHRPRESKVNIQILESLKATLYNENSRPYKTSWLCVAQKWYFLVAAAVQTNFIISGIRTRSSQWVTDSKVITLAARPPSTFLLRGNIRRVILPMCGIRWRLWWHNCNKSTFYYTLVSLMNGRRPHFVFIKEFYWKTDNGSVDHGFTVCKWLLDRYWLGNPPFDCLFSKLDFGAKCDANLVCEMNWASKRSFSV